MATGARLRADRRRRALRRRISHHPWSTVMETLRSDSRNTAGFCPVRRRTGRRLDGARFLLSGNLAIPAAPDPGISLRPRPLAGPRWQRCRSSSSMSARRTHSGLPTKVEQSDLYQAISAAMVIAPASSSPVDGRGLLSTSPSRRRELPANTARRSSSSAIRRSPRASGIRRARPESLMVDPKPDLTPRRNVQALPARRHHPARTARHPHARSANIPSSPASSRMRWATRPAAPACTSE